MVSLEGRLIRPKMKYERDFLQIPNGFVRDEKLSYRARGILALLLSHETGFAVTLKALASTSPKEGLDAVRGAVQELEQHGYLRRYSSRRGGMFRADDWELTDPAELLMPSILTALDKTTRKASTALDKTTRTALDNPTTRRTQEEDRKDTQPSHKSVPVWNLPKCPARLSLPCSPDRNHVCLDCHQAVVPFAQPIVMAVAS